MSEPKYEVFNPITNQVVCTEHTVDSAVKVATKFRGFIYMTPWRESGICQKLIQQTHLTRKLAAGDGYEQLYWPLPTSQTRNHLLGDWPTLQMYREGAMYINPKFSDKHNANMALDDEGGYWGTEVVAVCSKCLETHEIVVLPKPASEPTEVAAGERAAMLLGKTRDSWLKHINPKGAESIRRGTRRNNFHLRERAT